MFPVNCGSHSDYQNFVLKNLRKYYPDPNSIARSTWDIIDRFWNLDLSYTDELLRSKYSVFGPASRTPSCMQKSYLLSIDFKLAPLTDWAAQLKINPLHAILSGFDVSSTPGVGTFYDFLNRLWNFDVAHLSPHLKPLTEKIKKPKSKGSKADPIEKVTVDQLISVLQETSFSLDQQPYGSLFKLYRNEFLDSSVSRGLIDPDNLSLAGDDTPVVTSHRQRQKRVCDCFYHGYDLYMLVAANFESNLPIFPLLNPASKHDSHGFLETMRMNSFLPEFNIKKLLLDSAHDATPHFEA